MNVKRIAIKRLNGKWQWYGPPVCFTAGGYLEKPPWFTAYSALERMCEEIVELYGITYFTYSAKIVEAPSEQAMELVNVGEL